MKCYRIVEMKNGKPHSLFHGTNHCRELPTDVWINADKKEVSDGSHGRAYLSGFHVFLTKKEAEEFFKKMFRNKKDRVIIECGALGLRPKSHSKGNVFLADKILIWSVSL